MPPAGEDAHPMFACAISKEADGDRCAAELAADVFDQLKSGVGQDLAVLVATPPLAERLGELAERVQRRLEVRNIIGCSAEGVLGGDREVEGQPAAALLVGSLPGVTLTPFTGDAFARSHDASIEARAELGADIGARSDTRVCMMLVDPFSVPTVRLLPALDSALAVVGSDAFAFGGLASAGRRAGENRLVLNGSERRDGLVGLTISGPVHVDVIVSQGCRPVGPTCVVTKAKGNLVMELGGRPALEVAKASLERLGEDDRKLLAGGLFLGQAANEYKPRLGRGDFLVRPVMGAEPTTGAIAVGEMVRTGQTVQFHLRDHVTAREDLELLLDGQVLHGRPAGALLVTCNGRGKRLFGESGVDSGTIQRAFTPLEVGALAAKAGSAFGPSHQPLVPLAGFFAAGEIGPMTGASMLHGHTAAVALFRSAESATPDA